MTAIMSADEVGIGVVLQDMQASLPASSHRNYTGHLGTVAELSRATDKPIVVISPTAEIMSERLLACLEGTGMPPLRGLCAGPCRREEHDGLGGAPIRAAPSCRPQAHARARSAEARDR